VSNETGKSIAELRAEAKPLGINTFGMNATAIQDAIDAEKVKRGQTTEYAHAGEDEKDLTPLGDEDYEQEESPEDKGAAPQGGVDEQTAIALYAAKMAKEALEQLKDVQKAQPKKAGTPEEEIVRRHNRDKENIRTMEKVPITIPGGYPGAPKSVTSTVNGHRIQIKTGATVMVPKAHAENIMRIWEQKQKNMERFEADEKKALSL
jgi:hypothetical protein